MITDVLIVGCGVAGLYCALNLPENKKITVVTILGELWLFYVFPLTSIDFSALTYNENATSRKLFSVSLAIQLSP
jgi:uncharacterized metal-binding protein